MLKMNYHALILHSVKMNKIYDITRFKYISGITQGLFNSVTAICDGKHWTMSWYLQTGEVILQTPDKHYKLYIGIEEVKKLHNSHVAKLNIIGEFSFASEFYDIIQRAKKLTSVLSAQYNSNIAGST